MKYYILDSGIVINHPEVFALDIPDGKFAITETVFLEIINYESSPHIQTVAKMLRELMKNKTIHFISAPGLTEDDREVDYQKHGINLGDRYIAKAILDFGSKTPGITLNDVVLVSNDTSLIKYCQSLKISAIKYEGLRALSSGGKTENEAIVKEVSEFKSNTRKYVAISALVGAASALAINYSFKYSSIIFEKINIWGTIAGILIISVGFYWSRCRYRLAYGFCEYLFGAVTAIRIFYPTFDLSRPVDYVKLIGSVYIMVRGLDNIGSGLKIGHFYLGWQKIFFGTIASTRVSETQPR